MGGCLHGSLHTRGVRLSIGREYVCRWRLAPNLATATEVSLKPSTEHLHLRCGRLAAASNPQFEVDPPLRRRGLGKNESPARSSILNRRGRRGHLGVEDGGLGKGDTRSPFYFRGGGQRRQIRIDAEPNPPYRLWGGPVWMRSGIAKRPVKATVPTSGPDPLSAPSLFNCNLLPLGGSISTARTS
jgi:hypothetical protein